MSFCLRLARAAQSNACRSPGACPSRSPNLLQGRATTSPQFLPDGQHFLYYVSGGKPESDGIYVSSLEDAAQPMRLLPDASPARYSAAARLAAGAATCCFVREATLMAQPFDPETLRLTGEVFPVAEPVTQFSVSESGELAYMSGATASTPGVGMAGPERQANRICGSVGRICQLPPVAG